MHGLEAGAHQPRAARSSGLIAVRAGARPRGARPRRQRGVRRRRSSGRARLRRTTRGGIAEVAALLASTPGIDVGAGRRRPARSPRPPRALRRSVAVAEPDAWFTYYYWLDDRRRAGLRPHGRHPPQAGLRPGRAVPRSRRSTAPCCRSAGSSRRRKAGFRTLLDVTPLDATLVRGSHGRYGGLERRRPVRDRPGRGPVPQRPHEFGGCVLADFESDVSVSGVGSMVRRGSKVRQVLVRGFDRFERFGSCLRGVQPVACSPCDWP